MPGTLSVTAGEELLPEWAVDDGWAKVFCSQCGSALWSRSPTDAQLLAVRLGAFDSNPGIRPSYRQFVAHAATWEDVPSNLPVFAARADLASLTTTRKPPTSPARRPRQ